MDHRESKRVPERLLLYWLHQSFWLCGSQETVENSERDRNTRPPDLPPEKSVYRSRSNSWNWAWNNRVCSNSCPLSQWCYLTISSSSVPFSFSLRSFLASGCFPVCWLFPSSGQSNGASASTSVLPMNIQGCFPLGLTHLISLQSKGVSKVLSSTTTQEHQFFSAQSSLWSNSYICKWLLEKS